MLNATTADEWLFNKDLGEKLKMAKSLEKSAKDLKPQTRKLQPSVAKTLKNSKAPPRQTPYPRPETGRRPRYSPRERKPAYHRKQNSNRTTSLSHRRRH